MYFKPKPLVYKTQVEGTPYKNLSLSEIKKEFNLLTLVKNHYLSEINFVNYHKKIISTFLNEIKKDLNKSKEFLIKNSSIKTYYKTGFFKALVGGKDEKTVWQWNKSVHLKKFIALLKKTLSNFIFLESVYHSNGVMIDFNKKEFQCNKETEESNLLYGPNTRFFEELKKMYLPIASIEPIKKLLKAKKYKISDKFKLTSGALYVELFDKWGQERGGGQDAILKKNFHNVEEILKDLIYFNKRGNRFKKLGRKWIDSSFGDLSSLDQVERTTKIVSALFENATSDNIDSETFLYFKIKASYSDKSLKKFSEAYLDKNYTHLLRRLELLIRAQTKAEVKRDTKNWVYVLSNKSFPKNYLKIGWTSYPTVKERAEELSTTGLPFPFKVEYAKKFKNAELYEKKCHIFFTKKRVRGNREFFEVSLSEAKSFIESLTDE